MVRTAGGQIDLGEVHGSVHAETGGGGIRVISVAGPMEVATNGGSICLTRVANRVHAETGEGTITAWINPDESEKTQVVRLPGPSQLASHTGDIVVYLPRNIAMTIDATVENGGPGRIQADPGLPLTMQWRPKWAGARDGVSERGRRPAETAHRGGQDSVAIPGYTSSAAKIFAG